MQICPFFSIYLASNNFFFAFVRRNKKLHKKFDSIKMLTKIIAKCYDNKIELKITFGSHILKQKNEQYKPFCVNLCNEKKLIVSGNINHHGIQYQILFYYILAIVTVTNQRTGKSTNSMIDCSIDNCMPLVLLYFLSTFDLEFVFFFSIISISPGKRRTFTLSYKMKMESLNEHENDAQIYGKMKKLLET